MERTSDSVGLTPDADGTGHKLGGEQVPSNHSSMENVSSVEDNKYDLVLEMKEMANKGLAAEVVEEVNAVGSDFFNQNPILFFQLKQVEFFKLDNVGNLALALKVATTYLGPLAATNQALLKPLKGTLSVLLNPNEAAAAKKFPLSVLATSLQLLFLYLIHNLVVNMWA